MKILDDLEKKIKKDIKDMDSTELKSRYLSKMVFLLRQYRA
jgi:hypothetical protein